jgi:hypothetical protein
MVFKDNLINILMFAPWFPPHRNSEAHASGNLVLAFIRKGWAVDIISEPLYDTAVSKILLSRWQPFAECIHSVPRKLSRDINKIFMRINSISTTRHPIRGVSWALSALKKARELSKKTHYDLILSRSMPHYGHLPALVFAKEKNLPWIANWNDPEPAIRSPKPYGQGKDAVGGYWMERYVKTIVDRATFHTFPSERILNYMASWAPGLRGKSGVIPHIALNEALISLNATPTEQFTLCHAGIFDRRRNPMHLFTAIRRVIAKYNCRDTFRVILLGNNISGPTDLCAPQDLKDIVDIQPWCDYEEALQVMKNATVLLVIEGPMEEGIYLPAKFADYVQCRRPILALSPTVGCLKDIISLNGGGVVTDCTSSDDIASALEKMFISWKRGTLDNEFSAESLFKEIGEDEVTTRYEKCFAALGLSG